MNKAYIVVSIDKRTTPPTVWGAGIFSEPNPTGNLKLAQVTLATFEAATYAEAAQHASNFLRDDYCAWCGPIIRSEITQCWRSW